MNEEIKNEDDLVVGEYYFLYDKSHPHTVPRISECKAHPVCGLEDVKYFEQKIWAIKDNPQAFERWKIYGPVQIPAKSAL